MLPQSAHMPSLETDQFITNNQIYLHEMNVSLGGQNAGHLRCYTNSCALVCVCLGISRRIDFSANLYNEKWFILPQ